MNDDAMQEVEVKLHTPDLESVKRALDAAGATPLKPRVFERNLRYDSADGTLMAAGIVLRLRPMEPSWRNSADLPALETSVGALSPDFASDTVAYGLAVPSDTSTITLTPQVTNFFATYTITADTHSSVTNDRVDLSPADNEITITAADEITTKSHTINVTR